MDQPTSAARRPPAPTSRVVPPTAVTSGLVGGEFVVARPEMAKLLPPSPLEKSTLTSVPAAIWNVSSNAVLAAASSRRSPRCSPQELLDDRAAGDRGVDRGQQVVVEAVLCADEDDASPGAMV